MSQFHFDPETYLEMMRADVPRYDELQDVVAAATAGSMLGGSSSSARARARRPGACSRAPRRAHSSGIDSSEAMLAVARAGLWTADLRVQRLEDPLPEGPFELVVSVLAVHHLEPEDKRDLFGACGDELTPGGRFVLADLVVPERPEDVVTPATPGFDKPDTLRGPARVARRGRLRDVRGVVVEGSRGHSRRSAQLEVGSDGLRDARDPRRPGAGPDDGRDHDADLPDLDVRAGGGRRPQGLRLRARREPDPDGAADRARLARERRARDRVLLGSRRDDDADAPRQPGRARRPDRGRVRRRLPDDLAGLRAEGLRLRLPAGRPVRRPRRPPRRAHADGLDRDAVEPAAQRRRHPRRCGRRARRRRDPRRRQHLRDAVPAAAARPRRRRRRPLGDEVPRRPLRPRRSASSPRTTRRSRSASTSCRSRSAPCRARSTAGSRCAG